MTPKEFDCITVYDLELKLKGFGESRKRETEMVREIAYNALTGPSIDPKGLKGLTREKYWPIDAKEKRKKIYRYPNTKKKSVLALIAEVNGTAAN